MNNYMELRNAARDALWLLESTQYAEEGPMSTPWPEIEALQKALDNWEPF